MLEKKVATAYRTLLNASAELESLVRPMLRAGFLPKTTIADFALEHAHFYQCSYLIRESGSVRFFIADTEQVSANVMQAAQVAWQRGISKFVKTTTNRGGNTRGKTDPAEAFMATFHKLDKRVKARVIALLKSEGVV